VDGVARGAQARSGLDLPYGAAAVAAGTGDLEPKRGKRLAIEDPTEPSEETLGAELEHGVHPPLEERDYWLPEDERLDQVDGFDLLEDPQLPGQVAEDIADSPKLHDAKRRRNEVQREHEQLEAEREAERERLIAEYDGPVDLDDLPF
jgi:hypothetical protein